MPKILTEAQIIGQQGEQFVSHQAYEMGFTFTPHGPLEAGIDGFLEIRDSDDGRTTGQFVAVQVKTTKEGAYPGETNAGFSYMMREDDLAYWRGANVPVIIVLVHLQKKAAYWMSIDAGQGDGHRQLQFDKRRDAFDKGARDSIANLCVDRGQFGIYFPALNHGEQAHLNLLRVCLPASVYVGFSPHTTGRDALFELLKHEDRPPDDWVIRARQFMSFRDPTVWPLSEVVDGGTVERLDCSEVAFPDDEADEHAFIELLRRTLATQLEGTLVFEKQHRTFYFPARRQEIRRAYSYRSLKKHASAQVVQVYPKGGNGGIKFVRHHAFTPRFWRVEDEWLMSVTPTYHFTWDGVRPDRFASERLAGKKQREHNSSLSGQLAMWKHLLIDDVHEDAADLFLPKRGESAHRPLSFEALDPLKLQKAVPEATWRRVTPGPVDDGLFAEEIR